MKTKQIKIAYKGSEYVLQIHNVRLFKSAAIGCKDKNKKTIKEGDIVVVDGQLMWGGVVTYSKSACGFAFDNPDIHNDKYTFSYGWEEGQLSAPVNWEIIGSIYK